MTGIHQMLVGGGVKDKPGEMVYTPAGTYRFKTAAGYNKLNYTAVAGGGSGSTCSFCGDGYGGGGGGSGGFETGQISVNSSETLTIQVGAGGAEVGYPGTCGGHRNGNVGGDTTISRGTTILMQITGGHGGNVSGAYPAGGTGGAGGSPNGVAGSGGGNWYYGHGGNNGTGYGTGGNGGGGGMPANGQPGNSGYLRIWWN